jgi:hypothetical protein
VVWEEIKLGTYEHGDESLEFRERRGHLEYLSNWMFFNIVFTVYLIYIKNQDQLDAQSLLKALIVVLH